MVARVRLVGRDVLRAAAASRPRRGCRSTTLFTWMPGGSAPRSTSASSPTRFDHVDPARHRRRLADPPLLDRLHARRPALLAVLRLPQPVRGLDARSSSSARASSLTFLGWEGVGPLLVPADLVLVRAQRRRGRGQEGVRHQPRRRRRLPARDVPHLRERRHARLRGDEPRARRRPRRRHRHRDRAAACSSARSARARRSRCTSGCPTRWRARRRCRRSSTRRRWSPRACSSCAARTRSSRRAATRSTVVAWVGALTALLAGTVALVQPDIKRVLAYSTISQLGYMFLARRDRRVQRRGLHGDRARVLQGLPVPRCRLGDPRQRTTTRTCGSWAGSASSCPYTAIAFIVAWLAIAGVPPFSGFWSKDEILARRSIDGDYGLWIVGLVAAVVHRLLHDPAGLPRLLRQRALRHAASLTARPVVPTTP